MSTKVHPPTGGEAQPAPPSPQNTVPKAIMQVPVTEACGSLFRGHGFQLQIKEETISGGSVFYQPRVQCSGAPATEESRGRRGGQGTARGTAWPGAGKGSQRCVTLVPDVEPHSGEQGASWELASAPRPLAPGAALRKHPGACPRPSQWVSSSTHQCYNSHCLSKWHSVPAPARRARVYPHSTLQERALQLPPSPRPVHSLSDLPGILTSARAPQGRDWQ